MCKLSVTIIPKDHGTRTRERVPAAALSGILARAAADPKVEAVHVFYPTGEAQLFPMVGPGVDEARAFNPSPYRSATHA